MLSIIFLVLLNLSSLCMEKDHINIGVNKELMPNEIANNESTVVFSPELNEKEAIELLARFKKLPIELKNEILKNSFYIDSIDCVAVIKEIPSDDYSIEYSWRNFKKQNRFNTPSDYHYHIEHYWRDLTEQKRFSIEDFSCWQRTSYAGLVDFAMTETFIAYRSIPFKNSNQTRSCDLLGPNKNNILIDTYSKMRYQIPIDAWSNSYAYRSLIIQKIKDGDYTYAIKTKSSIACLHPYQNSFITYNDKKFYIRKWYVDEQGELHRKSRIYIPNSIVSIIGYDTTDKENNNLIGLQKGCDDTIENLVMLDISYHAKNHEKKSKALLTHVVPLVNIKKLKACHEETNGLYFEFCKKYPNLFLINLGKKSYLFDRSGNSCVCIKTFDQDISFCQPKDTLCNNEYVRHVFTSNANVISLNQLPKYYQEKLEQLHNKS